MQDKSSPITPVILFDGVCNFCNSSVNFVIKRDRKQRIKFAPLQTDIGKCLVQEFGLPADDLQSFIFIEKGLLYKKSTSALKVCKYLNGLWPLCYGFIIIPVFIRDGVYDFIAKRRYKWFGRKEECIVPSMEIRSRFLA